MVENLFHDNPLPGALYWQLRAAELERRQADARQELAVILRYLAGTLEQCFREQGIEEEFQLHPFGSVLYGMHTGTSDFDILCVVKIKEGECRSIGAQVAYATRLGDMVHDFLKIQSIVENLVNSERHKYTCEFT